MTTASELPQPIDNSGATSEPASTAGDTAPDRRNISTGGGTYVEGDLHQRGVVVGGDARITDSTIIGTIEHSQVTIQQEEQAYDVRGLENPYLGLRSFGYEDRAKYAGRERTVAEAVQKLTAGGAERTLLFVTGASGSGKSSFAKAGVLPALERYYVEKFGQTVRMVDLRPGSNPLTQLTVALRTLTKSLRASFDPTPEAIVQYIKNNTADGQVNLLVLDQFEELFTQSDPAGRDVMFALLEHLPPFTESLTHIIATMRSDFLPELFARKELYNIAKQGIDLYAMQVEELRRAILQPLQQRYPNGEKRFEGALLDKLAAEAAQDASYLPLLQVTLERLWNKGSLKLGAYGVDGTLADALRQQADDVYTYLDHATNKQQLRPDADRATMMQIFLELVNVSLDDNARRDVRCRRSYADLAQESADRARLIEELCAARLLSRQIEHTEVGVGQELDQVDIIHEALIRSWDHLRAAIAGERQTLRQRARFEQALQEWLDNQQAEQYLLDGVRLAEARELEQRRDVALRNNQARELLARSVEQREAERERNIPLFLLVIKKEAGYQFLLAADGGVMRAFLNLSEMQIAERVAQTRAVFKSIVDTMANDQYIYQSDNVSIPADLHTRALGMLAKHGTLMYRRLFYGPGMGPDARAMGDFMREYLARPGRRIKISAERFIFPWGLLYDRTDLKPDLSNVDPEGFWGLKHIIENTNEFANYDNVGSRIVVAEQLPIAFIANQSLDAQLHAPLIAGQRDFFKTVPGITVSEYSTTTDLCNLLNDPDCPAQVIYFYCQAASYIPGSAQGREGDVTKLILTDGPITLDDLYDAAPLDKPPLKNTPLIFLNCCQSAEMSPYLYDELLRYLTTRGALGIVGTQVDTPAFFAAEFAKRFFSRFPKGDQTLGEVLLDLRREFVEQHNNILGLVYAMYAGSDVRVVRAGE